MAGLLNSDISSERGSRRTLLVSVVVLAVALGTAFALYYRHANHADVDVTALRSVTVPLHTVYTHTGKVVGPDTAEDSVYIVAAMRVHDLADVPLFVKDITAGLTLADGSPVEATRVKEKDLDRVLQIVPALWPAIQHIAVPALEPEQTIAPHATADGYVLLQVNGPEKLWFTRRNATLTIDFYHQNPITVTLR